MSFDPFGDGQDEAQAEAPAATEAPKKAPAKKAAAKVTNVAASPEGKVTVTLKGGSGFEAPWIVIHGADVEDALEQLSDTDNVSKLMEVTQSAAKKFAGLAPASTSGSNRGGGGGGRAPRQAQEPPAGAPPKPGDDWVYKSGTSARGPWQAWMPPQHLKDTEKPVWF